MEQKFIDTYAFGKFILLFNRFSLKKAVVSQDIAQDVMDLQNNIPLLMMKLREKFSPEIVDSVLPVLNSETNLDTLQKTPHFNSFFSVFYLIPTNNCNLACTYCVVGQKKKHIMNDHILEQSISIIKQIKSDPTHIIIYGGEPLLNWPIVERAITLIRLSMNHVTISIITNGTLLRREHIHFFQKHNVLFSLSLDGREAENDGARIFENGIGSFASIMPAVKLLHENQIKFGISCTIGDHNFQSLMEIAKFFFNELKANSISFNLTRKTSNKIMDMKIATNSLIEVFHYLRESGHYEDRMMRKVRSFVEESFYISDCAGCGHQITFNADGGIGVCHIESQGGRNFAHVDDPDIIEKINHSDLVIHWRNRVPIKMAPCLDCQYISICGGGCGLEAERKYGSKDQLDREYCDHTQTIFHWMIQFLVKNLILEEKHEK